MNTFFRRFQFDYHTVTAMGRFGALMEGLGETSPALYVIVCMFVNMLPIPGEGAAPFASSASELLHCHHILRAH